MDPQIFRTPILDALERHVRNRPISLHVPGHKSGRGLPGSLGAWLGQAARLDLTELPGLDDLHDPAGAIQEAEELAAQAFGAERTYFLVNGSTSGNYAMLLAACRPGDVVLVVRDCHVSAIRGVQLCGARPIYLLPELDNSGYPAGVSLETLAAAIRKHPNARALFLTSPTYRGVCSRLSGIVHLAHEAGLMVLVDEAHGAHFAFHPSLPETAMSCGADLAVQSTHKTLGSLTQSAMLHAQGPRVNYARLAAKLRLVQSTSPSYLLLASLDAARAQMQAYGQTELQKILCVLDEAQEKVQSLQGICLRGENSQSSTGPAQDPLRWWIDCSPLATGFAAAEWLRDHHRIFVEFSDLNGILLIWSYADTADTVLRVVQALADLSANFQRLAAETDKPACRLQTDLFASHGEKVLPLAALTPHETEEAPMEAVAVQELAGRIAGEAIIPYPPGIPLVLPGERWSAEMRDRVAGFVRAGGKLQGSFSGGFSHSLVLIES